MSNWTQPVCDMDWRARNPEREPHRLTEPEMETCCFCGCATRSGIYLRISPSDVPYPSDEKP